MFDAGPAQDTPLMQDPAFAAALRRCGKNPIVLKSGLMLLHRRVLGTPITMLPRAVPPDDLDDQLQAHNLHRTPVILSPDRPCTLPRALRLRGPQYLAQLRLHPDADAARAALHPKWRNQLGRAEAAGLRVSHRPMSPKSTHPLLQLETAQARARRYANWPAVLTAAFAAVAPDQTRLFVVHQMGGVVAHMLFLRHGARATYHIGHITAVGKACYAHNLLLWQASLWLAAQGHSTLDLGLIDPRTPGLNRFKLRTGAESIQTGGTWLRWRPLARGDDP
ncbi:GNAT family N-acetyltransferase [Sulfitobacter sp. MF3-043]|uniref:GNAT family N-acetyltransferase n=1 Tax=Sulfitobacter sediminivivens TaxID=3252902 RepID=UPI0036D7C375